MPRIRAARSLLNDLLCALLGAPQVDHMVCEFSCSCCRSSVAAAADALCSFLLDGKQEALQGFDRLNGYTALQVGLDSSNDAVVSAVVRVIGALLQTTLKCGQKQQPTGQSQASAATHQQQQQQDHRQAGVLQHQARLQRGDHHHSAQQAQHQQQLRDQQTWLDSNAVVAIPHQHHLMGQPPVQLVSKVAAATAVPQSASRGGAAAHMASGMTTHMTTNTSSSSREQVPFTGNCSSSSSSSSREQVPFTGNCSSSSSSSGSWPLQVLLQLLLSVAASAARAVSVRAASLQELRQVLLLLADETSNAPKDADTLDMMPAAAPVEQGVANAGRKSSMHGQPVQAARAQAGACMVKGRQERWQGVSRQLLLRDVLAVALSALQDEDQSMRRAGSQVLAAAVVLQEESVQ